MSAIRDESALRDLIGAPTPLVSGKIANRLNDLLDRIGAMDGVERTTSSVILATKLQR